VNVDQSTRIAVAFARQAALSPLSSLCNACVDVLAVTGAGITVMGGGQAGPMCVSNQRMAALEDLQFTIGEGPCQDAYRSGIPVHAPRLDVATFARWPSFVERAQAAGFGGVFAFPLSLLGANVGVLTLYQDLEGDLSASQTDDSIALSEVLTETMLSLQDIAPMGELAAGLEDAVSYRAQVHQATGMVSIQLKISIAEALARIRAHAYATGRAVTDVAADIVGRRLRLIDDHRPPREEV
jgi:hypothetical protein